MPQTFVLPKQVAIISGEVAPLSVLRFYETGTSTPQNVYTDAALSNAVTSVPADAAGVFAKIYLNPNASENYRVTLENSAGVISYTEDDISRFQRTKQPSAWRYTLAVLLNPLHRLPRLSTAIWSHLTRADTTIRSLQPS